MSGVGGYPIYGGVPHVWGGYPISRPPPIAQSTIASTCYAAGGVPLAFTQEDFLVCKGVFTRSDPVTVTIRFYHCAYGDGPSDGPSPLVQ